MKNTLEIKNKSIPIRAAILEKGNISREDEMIIQKIQETGYEISWFPAEDPQEDNSNNINEQSKYSVGYYMCTGIIAVGKSKTTQQEISLLTHDYIPSVIGKERKSSNKESYESLFKEHQQAVEKLLEKFKEQIDLATLDVIIVGGEAKGFKSFFKSDSWKGYEDAINFDTLIIQKIFGINPVVITGPQEKRKNNKPEEPFPSTDIYFDTQKRRLYLVREPQKNSKRNESYSPEDLSQELKKW